MRRLGQHFLSDRKLLARIADAVEPHPGETVIEIGPGRGDLTMALLERGAVIVAIERDRVLAAGLETRNAERGTPGLTVVTGDALQTDWHALVPRSAFPVPHSALPFPQWKVVGNIPYYITSPLIAKALTPPLPERVVFLVQAEVADRLAASPGSKTYGALTVGVQAVARVERLFAIPAGAFRPPPRVASAVVRLTPLAQPLIQPAEGPAFRRFVTACFSQRRKQLRNAVAAARGIPAGDAAAGLERLGLDPTARPERVTVADFVRLLRWTA